MHTAKKRLTRITDRKQMLTLKETGIREEQALARYLVAAIPAII